MGEPVKEVKTEPVSPPSLRLEASSEKEKSKSTDLAADTSVGGNPPSLGVAGENTKQITTTYEKAKGSSGRDTAESNSRDVRDGVQPATNGEDASDSCEWDFQVYRCVQCGMAFSQQAHLVRHLKVHSFVCKTCGVQFSSDAALLDHEDSHKVQADTEEWEKHTCLECEIDFETESELSLHWSKHIFGCDFCSRTFLTQSDLMSHEKDHQKQNFSCDKCGKEFERKSNFNIHKQKYCRDSPKIAAPSTTGSTIEEMDTRLEASEENNKTASGHNLFEKLQSPQSARISHTDNEDDDDVVLIARSESGDGRFICTKCPKAFTNNADYEKHQESHSALGDVLRKGLLLAVKIKQEAEPESPAGQFRCIECNKTYPTEAELKRHHGRHTLPCDSCSRTFTNLKNLKSHMRMHTGKEVFECHTCGKLYARYRDFEKHVCPQQRGQRSGIPAEASSSPGVKSSKKGVLEVNDMKKRKFASLSTKKLFNPSDPTSTAGTDSDSFFSCKLCHRKYCRLGDLSRHMIMKHNINDDITANDSPDDVKPFVCLQCDSAHGELAFFTKHVIMKHPETDGMVVMNKIGREHEGGKMYCVHCKSEYDTLVSYNKHFPLRHPSERQFKCNKCKQVFTRCPEFTSHLEKHFTSLRIDAQEHFDCNLCQRSFLTRNTLNTHLRSLHCKEAVSTGTPVKEATVSAKSFPCTMCERSFTSHVGLTKHISSTHLGEKTCTVKSNNPGKQIHHLICKECKKAFSLQEELAKHMLQHHSSDKEHSYVESEQTDEEEGEAENSSEESALEEEDFTCNMCDRNFTRQSDLTNHTRHFCQKSGDVDDADSDSAPDAVEEFSCTKCGKNFKRQGDLTRHIRHSRCSVQSKADESSESSSESEDFSCTKCQRTFSRQGDLTKHNNRYHPKKLKNDTDPDYLSSEEPRTSKSETDEFPCRKCPRIFSRQCDLKRHRSHHHPKEESISKASSEADEEKLSCRKCKKFFSRQGDLTKHNNRYHPDSKSEETSSEECDNSAEDLSCEKCKKSFTELRYLTRHKQVFHPNDFPFICHKCKRGFVRKASLNNHKIRYHSDPKAKSETDSDGSTSVNGQFLCGKCDKTFMRQGDLSQHMMLRHPTKEEPSCVDSEVMPLSCNKCDKSFSKRSDLSRHLLYHHQPKLHQRKLLEGQFKCQVCEETFSQQNEFALHVLQHSREESMHVKTTSVGPFNCTKCERSFLKENNLQNHLLIFHAKESDDSQGSASSDNHHCKICVKDFTTRRQLKTHFNYHHPNEETEQPASDGKFHCQQCDKSFKLYGNLMLHMKQHPNKSGTSTGPASKNKRARQMSEECTGSNVEVKRSKTSTTPLTSPQKSSTSSQVNGPRLPGMALLCRECGKHFASRADLKKHEDTHVFMCRFCNRFFTTTESLKEHKLVHHKSSDGIKRCHDCGSCFKTIELLGAHKQKGTCKAVDLPAATTPKPVHDCELCGEVFRTEQGLDEHQEYHTLGEFGEDKEAKWGDPIVRQRTLTVQRKREVIEELFLCRFCDQTFLSLELVHRHERSHTDGH